MTCLINFHIVYCYMWHFSVWKMNFSKHYKLNPKTQLQINWQGWCYRSLKNKITWSTDFIFEEPELNSSLKQYTGEQVRNVENTLDCGLFFWCKVNDMSGHSGIYAYKKVCTGTQKGLYVSWAFDNYNTM